MENNPAQFPENLTHYEIQTIFGTFYHEGRDAQDARKRFWEWYHREGNEQNKERE